jgi:hypothetical protein
MLHVDDPDAVIADRLSGQGPFVATDPFMPPESFGEPEPALLRPPGPGEPPAPARAPVEAPPTSQPPMAEPPLSTEEPPMAPVRDAEPDIPLRPRAAAQSGSAPPASPAAAPAKGGRKGGGLDIDLTHALDELQETTPTAAPKTPPQNLESVFNDVRSEVSKQTGSKEASEHLALARTYLDMGMEDEAIEALRTAARAPGHRFEAASLLGRMYQKKDDVPHAIEWLERAAEAPAPGEQEARELLYDLGCILDGAGETARALAVFLELQSEAGEYRDIAARVDRLSRVQTGG